MRYPLDNRLREANEAFASISYLSVSVVFYYQPQLFLLTISSKKYIVVTLALMGLYRARQALSIKRYHRALLAMPYYALSTTKIPLSKDWLFIGQGFRWEPQHTQRLYQLKQIKNQSFLQRGPLYRMIRLWCQKHEDYWLTTQLNKRSHLNPFKPAPPVGGSPFLHGLGDVDKPVYIPQDVRVGHTFVVGTTRVGKTRLASILINQDIRNGEAVIVVDPKGDTELVADIKRACDASGRLDDFKIVHLGFPEESAHYNPLKNYHQVSEVATRITDAIAAEGEGKQFAAFAWKYVNIVALCLEEMEEDITYQNISFYISRLELLLMRYADSTFPQIDPDYEQKLEDILSEHNKKAAKSKKGMKTFERHHGVIEYVRKHINENITQGNTESLFQQVLIELFDAAVMDKQYYDKITASVGPVLSEINKSNAATILSSPYQSGDIELMQVIKQRKVLYIGLDSLTNPNIAQAVGKAFLSDLVSTAGKIYKDDGPKTTLNLHCDELSEIVQDTFIKILNKAGGAGFQVTAYAQTIQDMEVALGSKAKASVSEGNFNTLIMLRVKNEETANLLIKSLPMVSIIEDIPASSVNDNSTKDSNTLFTSSNEDRLQTTQVPMIAVDDVIALPKGQAFMLVNGGELYKVRLPLPKD